MRKGITPVISIIILLFITIALAGAAWTYLQSFMFGQISKTFSVPAGGAYCENGLVKLYITNTAYQGSLLASDFILADVDGTQTTMYGMPLAQGKATLAVNHSCGTACCSSPPCSYGCCAGSTYYTVNLGTSSTVIHQRVYCP